MTTMSSSPRFSYVTANDVYASLEGGGSVAVEEMPGGELGPLAKRIEEDRGAVVVQVGSDGGAWNPRATGADAAPQDTITVHPDECDRLALFDRAIEALQNARAALVGAGYVDWSERQA
jgi:hypothetical protein